MNSSLRAKRLRGATRAEALAGAWAVLLLAAAGGQFVSTSAQLAPAQRCLRNLQRIGGASHMLAASDLRGIPHQQSTAGYLNWIGLGAFDWGGGDGVDSYYGPNCASPGLCLSAATRPYNQFFTAEQYDVYHCPSDTGYEPNPNYQGHGSPNPYLESVFTASGASYQGDFLHFVNPWGGGLEPAGRFGSFMRPLHWTPAPSETLLFYEGRFAQAFLSTADRASVQGGVTPTTVTPWHLKTNAFNVLFMDGHTGRIPLTLDGPIIPINSFPIDSYPYRSGMFRGPGWRYDAFPDEWVLEDWRGDPVEPGSSTLGSAAPAEAPPSPPGALRTRAVLRSVD